jgi:hypothetical protein
MGDSLFYGDSTGEVWTAIAYQKRYMSGSPTPLSVSYGGGVAWGNLIRKDSNAAWVSSLGDYRYPTALRILGYNRILHGNGYANILLSSDAGQSWSTRYESGSNGSIVSMVGGTWGGWEFAAPQGKEIVFSRDQGRSWNTLSSALSSPTGMDCATHLNGDYLALEQRPYQQVVWGVNRYSNGHPILLKILPGYYGYDLVHVNCQEIPGLFRATISAFAVNYDWRLSTDIYKSPNYYRNFLWIGTWGEGLFVSQDEGKTWVADNEGLNNLFVEDIWTSERGTVLALTQGGLFRRVAASPSSVKNVTQKSKRKLPEAIFSGTRVLRSKFGTSYTVDGRGALPFRVHP